MKDASGEGKILAVNDFEMYFEIYGDGDPLVLLHNFTGSTAMWKPLIPPLAKHFKLIVPDLRGHGRSTNPSNEFTHRQAALDIFALLDHLGITQFKAIGVSSGGMTLVHMATHDTHRIETMILVGSTIYFGEAARTFQKDSLNADWWDWERLRQEHVHGDEQIHNLLRQFHQFSNSYDDMNFTAPYLSTITARTLIVHGDRDLFFPVNIPVEVHQAIADSYLWIIPNGGHIPIFEEKHQEYFTTIALDFLANQWE